MCLLEVKPTYAFNDRALNLEKRAKLVCSPRISICVIIPETSTMFLYSDVAEEFFKYNISILSLVQSKLV